MRRARKRTPNMMAGVDALTAWSTFGIRWAEMMAASGAVIAHRTARQNTPAEVLEMATEKGVAALQASQAMAQHWMRLGTVGGAALPLAWARMLSSGVAPYRAKALRNARGLPKK